MNYVGIQWSRDKKRFVGTNIFGAGLLLVLMTCALVVTIALIARDAEARHEFGGIYPLLADILLALLFLGCEGVCVLEFMAVLRRPKLR